MRDDDNDSLQRDTKALQKAGQTTVKKFAEAGGVSRQTARIRLNRLVDEGRAETWREDGMVNFYVACLPPNLSVLAHKGKRKP